MEQANEIAELKTKEIPKGSIDIRTADLTIIRMVLRDMIAGVEAGPRSRGRSLVVTKLQEAEMWAGHALFAEPDPTTK